MREEAVVSKQAFVREELIVKKTIERRVEQIDETVRRTEVETERLPGGESRPAFSGFASSNVREPEQR
jgi:stress response protein YsnF